MYDFYGVLLNIVRDKLIGLSDYFFKKKIRCIYIKMLKKVTQNKNKMKRRKAPKESQKV